MKIKNSEVNILMKEAKLFEIRSPFRQGLYVIARNMGYPPLKAWVASGYSLNVGKCKIDDAVIKKYERGLK